MLFGKSLRRGGTCVGSVVGGGDDVIRMAALLTESCETFWERHAVYGWSSYPGAVATFDTLAGYVPHDARALDSCNQPWGVGSIYVVQPYEQWE